MGLRATGHIPDHPAVVDARVGLHLHPEYGAMRAGTMPLATHNRALLGLDKGGPGIRDQKRVGACEGFANTSGATLQFALDGTPLPEPLSAAGAYLQALMVDASLNADGTLPPLIDTGTMPSSILGGWLTFGAALESVWGQLPVDTDTMYVDPTGANTNVPQGALIQPTPNKLYTGRACRLQGAYFIQSTGTGIVRDILRVLASKRVLTNAIPASGASFQNYSGGVLGALDGPIDHAQLIVDSEWTSDQASLDAFMAGDDSKVGSLILHGVNSWSSTWGEVDALNGLGGQYRADNSYVQCVADWCVLDVRNVA